ncbi:unnamed protein product [Symbiodinium sp. CCMP2592]|nr:unnamed protein product [Symbiodinium sp. CCMP2592]
MSDASQDRDAVMVQLFPRQYQHTVQLFFVQQVALELSKQLDVAGDAASRQFASVTNSVSDKDADQCKLWSAKDALTARARDVKAEHKRKSWGSASTRSGSSQDGLEECGEHPQTLDLFDPSEDVLLNLLPYLSVDDLMEWRVTSCQTRSPRVLIQHLSEMGRLDRPESILDFSAKWKAAGGADFDAELAKDVRQQKFFECRWWCMTLACMDRSHFPEADVHDIVSAILRDLFVHCCDTDKPVSNAAHYLVANYGLGCLPFVRQLIAETMLGRMEDLLPESAEISIEALIQAMLCTRHLTNVVRELTKSQRQKWVSLLVRALRQESFQNRFSETSISDLIADLKILWRADDDPRRSYAEADQQLRAVSFSENTSTKLRQLISNLRRC